MQSADCRFCGRALVEKALADCVVALFALGLLVCLVMRCACAGVVVVTLTTSGPWACPVCFFDLQILRSTMAPPGASRKTASGDVGRRTTRSSAATNGGDGDGQDIATGQQDSVTSDAEQEEQSEVADDDGTVTGSGDDGVTVETAGDTVGAVVATERTVRDNESTPTVTADQCLLKHEQDVGSMLSLENCKELARKRAMEDLFCMFKFPPKDKDSLLLYQIRMMEMLGYTQLATHLWNFSTKIWPELISTITEGLRCRRSSVTEALDKRMVGTLVDECCLFFLVHFVGPLN